MKSHSPFGRLNLGATGAAILSLLLCFVVQSCGSIRTHAGIEHEYTYDFDDGGYYHRKPKKHHKHHKKPKKHHHHHHDD